MTATAFDGLLVLDKPSGLTSRAVVNQVQRWFPKRTRIGHTGTLDPLATGVLVVCVGTATRLAEYVQDMDKTYRTSILFGARSDTDDADGDVTPVEGARPPERAALADELTAFVGEIDQVPPNYSAAHVTGQRAYDLARRGKAVTLQPRRVRVYAIDLLHYEYPHATLEVRCGKGTYIRSLARDLGEQLGCGAFVEALRRTRVGPFTPASAVPLDSDPATARTRLLPLSAAVSELSPLTLPADGLARLCHGQKLPLDEAPSRCVLHDENGELMAVAEYDATERRLKPVKVFARPTAK